MPAEILVTRDALAEDAVFILQCLRESQREGRSMHMVDVRGTLAGSVTLEFGEYLRFLRKHEYIAVDREAHTLELLPAGDRAARGEESPQLVERLEEFFADHIRQGVVEVHDDDEEHAPPPPPPEDATPQPGPAPGLVVQRADAVPPAPPPPDPARDPFAAVLQGAPAAGTAEDELIYLRGDAIGQGPIGTVFRGRHATLGTEVAIKEVRDRGPASRLLPGSELAARLKAELGAQARLNHPAIVRVHDLDLTVPQPFAVFDLCEGGNLRDRIKARGGSGLDPEAALHAFGQVLGGLAAAHERGLVHQNLKPENVLFDAWGNAKLGDFGLSRVLAVDFGDAARGLVVDTGNVSYLAPELLTGGRASLASDVYALGIMLYEMLVGRVPGRRSPEPSKAVSAVPEAIDLLFDRMTADRPEDRYRSAVETLADFLTAFPDGRHGKPGQLVLAVSMPARAPEPAPAASEKTPPDGTVPGDDDQKATIVPRPERDRTPPGVKMPAKKR